MGEAGSIRSSVMAGFGLLALVSLALGYAGLRLHLAGADPAPTLLDLVYYDLQLFVLDPQPLDAPGPLPWPLEVARFTAPAVTIYALAETVRLLLGAEYRRLRAREASGHAVVCGTGPLGQALAQRLREAGRTVVVIGGPAGDPPRVRGVFHVAGDARDPHVLRAAGAHRARAVYACEDDPTVNVAIAAAAHGLGRGTPVPAYAYVSDPGLCSALRARRLNSAGPREHRLDFFNLEELAARVLLLREPVTGDGPVLLLGLRHFGAALLVELARQCRLRAAGRVPVCVVAPGAAEEVAALRRTYPFIADWCDVTVHDAGPDGLRPLLEGMKERPQRVYVCYGDERAALTAALTVAPLWTGAPMIVRVGQRRMFAEAFGTAGLLEDVAGTLRFFAVTEEAGRPELIDEDVIERLARAIHERYVMGCAARGETPERNASMVPYEALTEAKKGQNRDQAAHIGAKLRMIGAVLAPSTDAPAEFAFTDDEIERLAGAEHRRWVEYFEKRGWTYGPERDDAAKRHPDLVDWNDLTEEGRDKDRAAVTALPAVLEDAGFRIVRVPAASRLRPGGGRGAVT
ncbi:RyR domain-containing protein [Nonomuraea sp. NPDC049309]|uniref:RyR domain-containing protein n=1 Tax=Nonomuraea sp. NPDC049309 TaxID=3364350 RepID=UPI00371C692E